MDDNRKVTLGSIPWELGSAEHHWLTEVI